MLVRWFQGKAVFTERDWLLVLDHSCWSAQVRWMT
jgi:hypothetical protein